MHILDQDIVRVELHSKPLKGLSYRDLELSVIIDSFNFDKYELIPLESEKGYRSKIRKIRLDEEMEEMEREILATEGKKNKFKQSDYNKNFAN